MAKKKEIKTNAMRFLDDNNVEYTHFEFDATSDAAKTGVCLLYTSYNLNNKYVPEKVAISGKKIWDDNHNEHGKRPDKIRCV